MHKRFLWALTGALVLAVGMMNPALAGPPPTGWTAMDIGFPDPEGSTDVTDGVWTIQGSGNDIWNNADNFHFVFQRVNGDATLSAHFLEMEMGDPSWTKIGPMVRESDYEGAPHAEVVITSGQGVRAQARLEEDAGSIGQPPIPLNADRQPEPLYMLAQRAGNEISTFHSRDGRVWTVTGATYTIPTLQEEALIGLAITSHQDGTLATGRLDNVVLQPGASLVYNLKGCPGEQAVALEWMPVKNAVSYNVYRAPLTETDLSKAVKVNAQDVTGNTFTDASTDLVNNQYYNYMVAAVTQDADGNRVEGNRVLSQARPLSRGLPAGYQVMGINEDPTNELAVCPSDLGAVLDPATGTITIRGSGGDIWNTADEFNYSFTEVEGDFQITARADTLPTNTNGWAKAGLMIRESTAPGSRTAFFVVTPTNGLNFQWRAETDAAAESAGYASVDSFDLEPPIWIRLTRKGDLITAEYSTDDGTTWLGSDDPDANSIEITGLPAKLLAGLAITSHRRGYISEATFSNLTITKL